MKDFKIKGEYITLGQLLKACGLVGYGSEAKIVIQEGQVRVDGQVETRRGRKLYGGETVSFQENEIKVKEES